MVVLPTLVTLNDVDWSGLCLWAVPAFLLLPLWMRSSPGERTTWTVAALLLALIWVDKVLDLQTWVHQFGQEVVRAVDPEWRLRGPHLWMRRVLLGSAFLSAVAGMTLLVRRDQHVGLAKIITLAGFWGIAGFLALRHLPAVQAALAVDQERWIEWSCLALVLTGLTWGIRGSSRGGAT